GASGKNRKLSRHGCNPFRRFPLGQKGAKGKAIWRRLSTFRWEQLLGVNRTNKVAAQKGRPLLCRETYVRLVLSLEEAPCHAKGAQGRAEEHYSRSTIGNTNTASVLSNEKSKAATLRSYVSGRIKGPPILEMTVKRQHVRRTSP